MRLFSWFFGTQWQISTCSCSIRTLLCDVIERYFDVLTLLFLASLVCCDVSICCRLRVVWRKMLCISAITNNTGTWWLKVSAFHSDENKSKMFRPRRKTDYSLTNKLRKLVNWYEYTRVFRVFRVLVAEQSLTSCSAPISYSLYFIYLLTYSSFLSAHIRRVIRITSVCERDRL